MRFYVEYMGMGVALKPLGERWFCLHVTYFNQLVLDSAGQRQTLTTSIPGTKRAEASGRSCPLAGKADICRVREQLRKNFRKRYFFLIPSPDQIARPRGKVPDWAPE
jgi:hypothetical protein